MLLVLKPNSEELGREAARVMLRRVRLRVAICTLGICEASFLEALAMASERAPDALDLDQVDTDSH